MSMAEAVSQRRSRTDSAVELLAGLAVVVLTILGLAGIAPTFVVAIATIVFGVELLLQGSSIVSEYTALLGRNEGAAVIGEIGAGGWSVLFFAGAAGIVLGILALLQIVAVSLVAIAVIAYGAALLLSALSTSRLALARSSTLIPDEPARQVAESLATDAMGIQTFVGLAAIVLGILALSGFVPATLVLIALLTLGSLAAVNSAFVANSLMGNSLNRRS